MKKEIKEERGNEVQVFAQDVLKGLSSTPKSIPSKYLYDAEGSRLFEEIMGLQEYYPSICEMEILRRNRGSMLNYVSDSDEIYLIDLGAGNGSKTMAMLDYFLGRVPLTYVPIDISCSALTSLENSLKWKYSDLVSAPVCGEYFQALSKLKEKKDVRKLVLFLGSTIGNFTFMEAFHFLSGLHDVLNPDDLLLIGFDLKKDPEIIRTAYFDSKGVTEKFNFNLLRRMNEELGANFIPGNFKFYPTYEPSTGEMKSFLVSKVEQEVYVRSLDKRFHFRAWEAIHTECSNKFDLQMIRLLAEKSGFVIEENFTDSKNYFVDSLWRVV